MTDTNTLAPTDAEILALNRLVEHFSETPSKYPEAGHGTQYHAGAPGVLSFAREVLAKWGAPDPTSGEAAARALLMDVKARVNTLPALPAVERREYAIRIKQDIAYFLAAPPAQEARVPLSSQECRDMLEEVDHYNFAIDLIRAVEKHHGITAAQKETPNVP